MTNIYCASDFHILNENANYPKIRAFLKLARENADKLILCGDILDLWVDYYENLTIKEPVKSCYEDLVKTANEIKTIYIRGNHDYNLDVPEFYTVDYYYQDGIYFTHGWEFDIEQRLGSSLYGGIVKYFPALYQRFFRTPFETISEHNVYTEQVRLIEDSAYRFVEKKGYNYLVFGHTHFPKIKGKLINCGDFVDSCSYVVINDGKINLKRI